MSLALRIVLILGSALTLAFVVSNIRKARVRIEDTLFWLLFCGFLLIISLFPQLTFYFASIMEIQSPINCVFLLIIFILIINQFYLSLKISKLLISQKELCQKIALDKKGIRENEKKNGM